MKVGLLPLSVLKMVNSFGFAVQKSFEGTLSILFVVLFWIVVISVFLLWLSVPFILLSIKKDIKFLKEEISKLKNDRLD